MSVAATARRAPAGPIRVASVPAAHPYVRHLADPCGGDGVVRLPDPTDPWWPPEMLEPRWLRANVERFDLLHVHFGFDAVDPDVLAEAGRTLRELRKPLVVTVHDLRNPHHESADLHDRQLGVLLAHADHVITLTEPAARVIRHRFGRRAQVLAHPHIVELDDLRERPAPPTRSDAAGPVVGLHLKSLRASLEPRVVDAAVVAVERVPEAQLRVDVHLDVADPAGARHDPALMTALRRYAADGRLDLVTHDCFDDDEFVEYLASLRVSVLPYRFGTHSGWLEACRDLGVAVVVSDCGCYRGQGDVWEFRCNEHQGFDAASCVDAITSALAAPAPRPIGWSVRRRQRSELASAHRTIYRNVLAAVSPDQASPPASVPFA